jgi:hypothetical protein
VTSRQQFFESPDVIGDIGLSIYYSKLNRSQLYLNILYSLCNLLSLFNANTDQTAVSAYRLYMKVYAKYTGSQRLFMWKAKQPARASIVSRRYYFSVQLGGYATKSAATKPLSLIISASAGFVCWNSGVPCSG